jgi:hypothetical protein
MAGKISRALFTFFALVSERNLETRVFRRKPRRAINLNREGNWTAEKQIETDTPIEENLCCQNPYT